MTVLDETIDEARRFGGLQRLYGEASYQRLRQLHVTVIGLGGVGSWTVEALARSGVARLTLVDMDHVSESNINRQIQALTQTVGQSKAQALLDRIARIHPSCQVDVVDDFVTPDNWLTDDWRVARSADIVIDACDDGRAKLTLATWALQAQRPLVLVGAAGGKRHAEKVECEDLLQVTHDPLLAGLRQRLRKARLIAEATDKNKASSQRSGLRCVFSREPVFSPPSSDESCAVDGSLNCHGYGSSVMVTATFGMTAASTALALCLKK